MKLANLIPLGLLGLFVKKKPTIKGAVFTSTKGKKLMDVKIRHLSEGLYIMYSPESDLRTVKKNMEKNIQEMKTTVNGINKRLDKYKKGD